MEITGAQILVESLIYHGTEVVFGYPGGAVLDIYDELYKNTDRIRHIISAHEQGAVHAADGYARVSGKPGMVLATSGPGATNLVTGIANAYLDSVPLVAITGNVTVPLLGKDSFQEVDIIGITQPVVKHSFVVRDVKDLASVISEAFWIASSGRHGPVLIDIPKSVQKAPCEYNKAVFEKRKSAAALPDLSNAIQAIIDCERPYIYCGGGVVAADAGKEIIELSEKLSAPMALSMMGLTAIPHSCTLNLGMCGMHGKSAAILAQSKADLMIAVGVRFSDRATGDVAEYTKNCTVIHIHIDEAELNKNVPSKIELCGNAKTILAALLKKLPDKKNESWLKKEKRTVLFTGDGSFGMNLNELATAVSQQLPILIILFNNGTLGMVRQWQSMFFEKRYSVTTLDRKTDFIALAKAFGADGRRAKNIDELNAALELGMKKQLPFLIHCIIDVAEMVFPMIPPGGSIRDIRFS